MGDDTKDFDKRISKIETMLNTFIYQVGVNQTMQEYTNSQVKTVIEYIKQNFVLRTKTIHLPIQSTTQTTYTLPYNHLYDSGVYIVESTYTTIILPSSCKENYLVQVFNYSSVNVTVQIESGGGVIYSKLYAPVAGATSIILEPNRTIMLYYHFNNNLSIPQWTGTIL